MMGPPIKKHGVGPIEQTQANPSKPEQPDQFIPATMTPSPASRSSLPYCLLFLAVLFMLMSEIDSMWLASIDLSHHYALVARIGEYWHLPPGYDTSLGEMNVYPRGGHQVAALFGYLLHSNILGMQLVSLLSLIGIWAALLWIILSLPRKTGIASAVILGVVLVINKKLIGLEVYGGEIIGNFFFSQFVAQALGFWVLGMALKMEQNGRAASSRYALIIASLLVLASIHLLPVVELLGLLAALVTLDSYLAVRAGKQTVIKAAMISGLVIGLATTLVVLHPSFAAMREISQNDGALSIKYLRNMSSIAAFCLIVAATSATLVLRWIKLGDATQQRAFVALKYIGLYGLAVAGLCLLQLVSAKIGHGSAYAVKKYIYSLNAILLIELILLAVLWKTKKSQYAAAGTMAAPTATASGGLLSNLAFLPIMMMVCFYAIVPWKKTYDTSDLVSLERQLVNMQDTVIPKVEGKYTYVTDLAIDKTIIPYMFSIGIFKGPREQNMMDILSRRGFSDYSQIANIITTANSSTDKFPACRRFINNHNLVLIDAACFDQTRKIPQTKLDFALQIDNALCNITGFSGPEPFGRWSDQKEASIDCVVPLINGKAPTKLVLDTGAFLDKVVLQRSVITLDGAAVAEYRYDAQHPKNIIHIPLTDLKDNRIRLHFTFPDATSPTALGLGQDDRLLGISIKSIEFQ
jgi:hypothetical protein